jgi:predicted AAA+ superfamily ATPase
MYVKRMLSEAARRAAGQFPALLVTGPRQSGKTTFLKAEFGAEAAYVSLDDPLERALARDDPAGFLDRFNGRPVILDEIQYAPHLFSYLKVRIDREREQCGRWLLTGSQQFAVMRDVSDSLAGRVAILDLLPFSLLERPPGGPEALAQVAWTGLYPEPALAPQKRDLWLRSYVQTYVERDVRQLTRVHDLASFETFLAACAARHGQELNLSGLARDCGLSVPTAKAWLGILEGSYLVERVFPWFHNFGKRLVKAPRLYFLDPSLPVLLTRQPSAEAALAGAMGGALFEGLMVSEAAKAFTNLGRRPDLYTWRSQDGLEVDLLVPANGRLLPIEIKLTASPTIRHVEALDRFRRLAGREAHDQALLVCRVPEPRPLARGVTALPWQEFPGWLRRWLE